MAALPVLFLSLSCAHWGIPDIKAYKQVPFVDAPEGVFVKTVSPVQGTIDAQEWQKLAPFLICIDDVGWAQIKESWLNACRLLKQNCDTQIESIETTIRELDEIARKVLSP